MPTEYVYMGATLKCSMGAVTSELTLTPQSRVQSGGKYKANIGDAKLVNITSFGTCKSMQNPAVSAATSAAQGVLTPVQCTPKCIVWTKGKTDILVNGMPALMDDSTLVCTIGQGIIEIKDSGQTGSAPASPKPPVLPPPEPKSLDNEEARKWYHKQLDDLPNKIDESLDYEGQARQASELRNQIRTDTRNAMMNQELAQKLFDERPNQPFEFYVEKYSKKILPSGGTMKDVFKEIIAASQRSDPVVDAMLGMMR